MQASLNDKSKVFWPMRDGAKASPAAGGLTRAGVAAPAWREIVARYSEPDARRGIIQLLNTGVPFLALFAAMLFGIHYQMWAMLVLALPAAALLLRLFMFQHDCGHGSFFQARWANDGLGRLLGVLTLTPYACWHRSHALHHASSGNLDRRGFGDIDTLTVREYFARPTWRRLRYRLYRHPLVLFGLGPAWHFLLRQRIPTGHPLRHRANWTSVLGTDVAIAALIAPIALTMGLHWFLLAYLPVVLLAGTIGVWLFYIQHQFEETYWNDAAGWSFQAAALEGASFYDLPRILHWVTGYIGFHHIHHLSSRIPNYRLRECFAENPELHHAKRLSLLASVRCARLTLWDETSRRLVSFRDARRMRPAAQWRSMT
jgi:omega-6 fatty acid desaturase (delta-12 desaturase)